MDTLSIFGGINFSGILQKIYVFIGIFFALLILGGVLTTFFILKKRKEKEKELYKVGWWEEVGERMEPGRMDDVEEVIIPGTTLRIFFCKKRDLWLPRFSRGVSKKLFYVLLTPTQQLVNFTLPSLSKNLKEANLEYDHTDMLWAAENSREYIKKNYRSKSVKWWQEYQTTIATAVLILVMTFSFVLIIYFLQGVISDLRELISQVAEWSKNACTMSQTSGVTTGA